MRGNGLSGVLKEPAVREKSLQGANVLAKRRGLYPHPSERSERLERFVM